MSANGIFTNPKLASRGSGGGTPPYEELDKEWHEQKVPKIHVVPTPENALASPEVAAATNFKYVIPPMQETIDLCGRFFDATSLRVIDSKTELAMLRKGTRLFHATTSSRNFEAPRLSTFFALWPGVAEMILYEKKLVEYNATRTRVARYLPAYMYEYVTTQDIYLEEVIALANSGDITGEPYEPKIKDDPRIQGGYGQATSFIPSFFESSKPLELAATVMKWNFFDFVKTIRVETAMLGHNNRVSNLEVVIGDASKALKLERTWLIDTEKLLYKWFERVKQFQERVLAGLPMSKQDIKRAEEYYAYGPDLPTLRETSNLKSETKTASHGKDEKDEKNNQVIEVDVANLEQKYKEIVPTGRLGPDTPCVVCNGIIPTDTSNNKLFACSQCHDPYHMGCETSLANWMSKPYLAMYLWSCTRCVRSLAEAKAMSNHTLGLHISNWESSSKAAEIITSGGNKEDTPELAKRMYSIVTKTKTSEVGFTGGATFGELIRGSNQRIVGYFQEHCNMDAKSTFLDMGSGVGQPCLHALLASQVKASIGIEVDDDRYRLSMINLGAVLRDDKLRTEARPGTNTFPCAFMHGNIHSAWSLDPFTHVVMFDKGIPEWTMKHIASMCNASTTLGYITSVHDPMTFIDVFGFAVRPKARLSAALAGSNSKHMMYVYERVLQDSIKSQQAYASARRMDSDTVYKFALPDYFSTRLATIPYLQDVDRVYRPWVQARVTALQNSTSLVQGKTRRTVVNFTFSKTLLYETVALWSNIAEQNRTISNALLELKRNLSATPSSSTITFPKSSSLMDKLPTDLVKMIFETLTSPTVFTLDVTSQEHHKLVHSYVSKSLASLTLFPTEDGSEVYSSSVMARILDMKRLNHLFLNVGMAMGRCIPLIDVMMETNAAGRYIPHIEIRGGYRYKRTNLGISEGQGGHMDKFVYAYCLVRRLDIHNWDTMYDTTPAYKHSQKAQILVANDADIQAIVETPRHLQVLNMTKIRDANGGFLRQMLRFSEWAIISTPSLTVLQLEFNATGGAPNKMEPMYANDTKIWTVLSKLLQSQKHLEVVSLQGDCFRHCQAGKVIVTIAANCPKIRVVRLQTTGLVPAFDLVGVLKLCKNLCYFETEGFVDTPLTEIQRNELESLEDNPNLLIVRLIGQDGEHKMTSRSLDMMKQRLTTWLKTETDGTAIGSLDLPIKLSRDTYNKVYRALVEQSIPHVFKPPTREELVEQKKLEIEHAELFPNGTATPDLPSIPETTTATTAAGVVHPVDHDSGKGEKRKFDQDQKGKLSDRGQDEDKSYSQRDVKDEQDKTRAELFAKRLKTYDDGLGNVVDPSKPIDIVRLFKVEPFGHKGQGIRITTSARYSTLVVSQVNSVINHDDAKQEHIKSAGKTVDKSSVHYGYTRLFNDARSQLGAQVLSQWERGVDKAEAKAKRDEDGKLVPGWDAHVPSQQDVENEIRDESIFDGETHPLSRLALPSYDCDLGPQFRDGALIRRVFESIIVHPNVDIPKNVDAPKSETKEYKSEHPRPMDMDEGDAGGAGAARPCYVSLGSGTLFEDFAILDQLVKSGRLVDRIILIDQGYGNLNEETLDGRYKPILQFMTWFNSYPQLAERGFDVIVYWDMTQYLYDLNSELAASKNGKSSLQADLFIAADVHFTLGSQPQTAPFVDLSWQSKERQYDEGRNLEVRHRIERMNHRDYQGYPFDETRLKRILKPDGIAYWLANQIVKLPIQYKDVLNMSWYRTVNESKRTTIISPKPEIAFGIVSVSISDDAIPRAQLYSVEKRYHVDDTWQRYPSWQFTEPRTINIQEWVIL